MEVKIRHLEMIQGVVNRMANNSFLLKSWSVVLVSALFVLAKQDSETFFILLAFLPVLAFWVLDGYFLWQERLYRKLYDKVRKMNESDIDFSMDTSSLRREVKTWRQTVFSRTLNIFYIPIIVIIVILTSIFYFCKGGC